ncbi:MAG TPA: dTMP kinase, partial [Dehalococcoidia bacterium]
MTAGLFITFEGGEGSGKSTQTQLLAAGLREAGRDVVALREPGGTALGEELRKLLLHKDKAVSVEAELLMFLAARAELVNEVIRPALDAGGVVICDRFSDSTVAYQGYGRGVDVSAIKTLNRWATGGLQPDLTVLLDVPVEVGRKRKHGDDDVFYRESEGFHSRVREGYRFLAASEPS